MWHQIKEWLAPPPVTFDPELGRIARLLNTILLTLLIVLTTNVVVSLIFNPDIYARLINVATLLITLGLLVILRRGYVRTASLLMVSIFWTAVMVVAFFLTGFEMALTTSLMVLVMIAGLLIGRRAATILTVATVLTGALYLLLRSTNLLPPPEPLPNQFVNLIPSAGNLVAIAVILNLTLRDLETVFADFRRANAELEEARVLLEQRVQNRTRALQTSIEVSRSLSTILDPQKLVTEVVEQVRNAFNYYHVHIYLYDDKQANLQMVGGTGEAGAAMLARGHQLPTGKGLVGRAAVENKPILISDVAQSADWLPNPLLPHTKSEAAVPIASGNDVMGVLDVQQNVVDGLTAEDVNLLQSVASQVAIALRNAQAYERAQSEASREAVVNTISQRIQTAVDVESVLQIAAQELGRALPARRAVVQIGGPDGENGRSTDDGSRA